MEKCRVNLKLARRTNKIFGVMATLSMVDKAVQVAIGSKRPRQAPAICETIPEVPKGKVEQGTQCGISETGSYGRNSQHKKWRYDDLLGLMGDKETLIHWLIAGLMAKERVCPMCDGEMSLARCVDRSDLFKWECGRQEMSKSHKA